MQDVCDTSDSVEVVSFGFVGIGRFLGGEKDFSAFFHGFIEGVERHLSSDIKGEDDMRKHDDIPQGDDRHCLLVLIFGGAGVIIFVFGVIVFGVVIIGVVVFDGIIHIPLLFGVVHWGCYSASRPAFQAIPFCTAQL